MNKAVCLPLFLFGCLLFFLAGRIYDAQGFKPDPDESPRFNKSELIKPIVVLFMRVVALVMIGAGILFLLVRI